MSSKRSRESSAPGRARCGSRPTGTLKRRTWRSRSCSTARTTSLRLLLDTHVLIWVLTAERALGEEAQAAIEDPQGLVAVSAVSAWEIEIKQHPQRRRWGSISEQQQRQDDDVDR